MSKLTFNHVGGKVWELNLGTESLAEIHTNQKEQIHVINFWINLNNLQSDVYQHQITLFRWAKSKGFKVTNYEDLGFYHRAVYTLVRPVDWSQDEN